MFCYSTSYLDGNAYTALWFCEDCTGQKYLEAAEHIPTGDYIILLPILTHIDLFHVQLIDRKSVV